MDKEEIKCREYNACKKSCLECDLILNKKCNKKFDFDAPKKFVRIERRDCNISWNECPTCGYPIGYRPTLTDFRCKRCNQRILW